MLAAMLAPQAATIRVLLAVQVELIPVVEVVAHNKFLQLAAMAEVVLL
jgi:hypothetical protein